MRIGKLSGGEQSRVTLALLMLRPANVLILDEPTNDLDLETLHVLQDCLTEFDGAVILVTHDRFFLDQVADEILAFPEEGEVPGKLLTYAGYAQWENGRAARLKAGVKNAPPREPEAAPRSAEAPQKKKKLSYKETRELAEMETRIQEAEARVEKLQAESQAPDIQSNGAKLTEIFAALSAAQQEVERLYARWSELEG